MPKCSFCGKDYESYKGLMVVESIKGDIRYFCSSKCRKYFQMKRKKRKWSGMKRKK